MPVILWRVPTPSSAGRSVMSACSTATCAPARLAGTLGGAALDQHAALAQVEQGLHGMRADEPQPPVTKIIVITSFGRMADHQYD